jgi:hypothetical protein
MGNYSRIFCSKEAVFTVRFGASGGVELRWAGGLFPNDDLEQNKSIKKLVLDQWLTHTAQSHLRVICATPF